MASQFIPLPVGPGEGADAPRITATRVYLEPPMWQGTSGADPLAHSGRPAQLSISNFRFGDNPGVASHFLKENPSVTLSAWLSLHGTAQRLAALTSLSRSAKDIADQVILKP